jgi:hypothetical protein
MVNDSMPPITQATLHTSMGDIVIELFPNHAPKTVANFVELAAGMREWVNPNTGEKTNQPLYDGTVFHRVIKGFMMEIHLELELVGLDIASLMNFILSYLLLNHIY